MYPIIGIPCHAYSLAEQSIYGNKRPYVQAVEDAGGLPMLIPMLTDFSKLEDLFLHLDGLLLSGGLEDIGSGFYGEQPHPALSTVDPQLDALEVALVTWALQRDLPVLGICRGMQLMNIVLGGTLYQDIPSQHPGPLQHRRLDLQRREPAHYVTIDQGCLLQKILGSHRLAVNSFHHQAVKEPGKDVHICGWADDGTAESLELPQHRFAVGIQCHPEDMYQDVPAFAQLFQEFVRTCAESSPERARSFQMSEVFPVL